MIRPFTILRISAFGSLVLGISAQAQPPVKDRQAMVDRLFGRFDADQDGSINIKDLPPPVVDRVSKLDANGDGMITREEFLGSAPKGTNSPDKKPGAPNPGEAKPGRDLGKLFERLDANGDGKLEADELPPRMKENLARLDKNGDGAIQKDELPAMPGKGPGAPGKGKRPDGGPLGGRSIPPAMLEQLRLLDLDGDGKIPMGDLPEPAQKWVKQLDADGDGSLSFEEMEKGVPTGKAESGLARLDLNGGPEALFKNYDGNSDGTLSKEELEAVPNLPLKMLDKDSDGSLTRAEVDEQWGQLKGRLEMLKGKGARGAVDQAVARRLFDQQDADADGRVSAEEAQGTLKKQFQSLDANGDGSLDLQEVEKGVAGRKEKGAKKSKEDAPAPASDEKT